MENSQAVLWDRLYQNLNTRLSAIKEEAEEKIAWAKKSRETAEQSLQELIELADTIQTKEEEILFFKSIKPRFQAEIIFYAKVYKLEQNRPVGSVKKQKKYFNKELKSLRQYFNDDKFIYQYLRSGDTQRDEQFFFKPTPTSTIALYDFDAFTLPSTPIAFDNVVARIKAHELLQAYLVEAIAQLKQVQRTVPTLTKKDDTKVTFTGPKIDLVLFIYAYQKLGWFGGASLESIFNTVNVAFNAGIDNHSRSLQEGMNRKSGIESTFKKPEMALQQYMNELLTKPYNKK